MKVTREILALSNPSFRNIPDTTIEDTARRRAPIARKVYTLKERIARERTAYVAKMRAVTAKRREQDRRRAEYQVQKAAKAALAQKMETTSIHKAAGITPQVRRLAAEGHKGAIAFLSAARGRVRGAQAYLSRNPTSYTMGRGRYKATYTYKNKWYTMGVVHTMAAGQNVQSYTRLYQQQTRALGRAKGAAKGASAKAGPSGSDLGGGQANVFNYKTSEGGTLFKRTLSDSIGISDSVKTKVTKGTQQVSGSGLPGSIGSQNSPITFVNTTGFSGQPIGNTLDSARAQKIANETVASPHPMDLTKQQQVAIDIFDSKGNVVGRTTTQESKRIAYGGLMNQTTRDTRHYKISLGGDGSLTEAYQSSTMQNMLYGFGLAQAEKDKQNKAYYENAFGVHVKNIVGPSNVGQKKDKHPLEVAQDYAYAHLKLTQKHPLLFPPLEESRAGALLTVVSLGVGLVNLEKQARQFFSKQTSGFALEEKDFLKEVKEPSGEFLSGTIEKTISTGGNILEGFSEGGKRFMESAKDFGILGTLGNVGLYVTPVGKLPKPIKPFHFMTKEGPVLISKQLSVPLPRQSAITLGGKYTKELGGKYFIGKPKFKDIPYQARYDIPSGTRGFEQAGVQAVQQSIFRSHIPQMEASGLIKSRTGVLEKLTQKQQRVELGQKQKLEKSLPPRSLEALTQKEQTAILKEVSVQQRLKRIEGAKGSLLSNLIKSKAFTSYSQGKINPAIQSFKTSPEVKKDIFRIVSEKNQKRKIGDFDLDETKEGLGLLAAKDIVKAKVGPGRILSRKGANIFISDKLSKTSEEVINIPKIKNQGLEAIEAGGVGQSPMKVTGKSYGQKFPGKTHKIKIYHGSGQTLKVFDPKFQSPAKKISITALQSKESLLQTRGMTETTAKKMLGGARTAMSPFGPRSPKDPVDDYMQGLKSIKLSLQQGKIKQAEGTSIYLKELRDYHNYIPWNKELTAWKPKLEFGSPSKVIQKGEGGSINLGEISSAYGKPLDVGLKGTSLYGSPSASINLRPESPLGKNEFYHVGDVSGRVSAGTGFFLTKSVSTALRFGEGDKLYKVTIDSKAKILKQFVEDDDGASGIASAKKQKYQALDRPISTLAGGDGDREFIVLDSKIISSVRQIKKPSSIVRSPLSPGSAKSTRSISSLYSSRSAYSSSSQYRPSSKSSYSPLLSARSSSGRSPVPPSRSPSIFVPSPKPSPIIPPSPRSILIPESKPGITPSLTSLNHGGPTVIRLPRRPKGLFVNIRIRTSEPIRRPRKPRADFLGSTHVAEIRGFRSKRDITYGRTLTYNLTKKDIKKSAKGIFEKPKKRGMVLAKHKNLFTASKRIRL